MLKEYWSLVKPGLLFGNVVAVLAGFALASRGIGSIDFLLLLLTTLGISFVIASGCVFNNYIDRDIDAKMERTKDRVLVKGIITPRNTIIYGIALGALGFFILGFYTNLLTLLIAFIGFFVYVGLYSLWWKRHSIYGPIVGSISGAVPPVVGYCAVTDRFDVGALLLFLALCLWQIPHFFSIAIYRLNDYAAASVPTFPIKKGLRSTKTNMLFYIIAFIAAALLFTAFGYAGYVYFGLMTGVGLGWLGFCIKGFRAYDEKLWARKMFFVSLVVILTFFVGIAADAIQRVRVI